MIEVCDWGLVDYNLALQKQEELQKQVIANPDHEFLIFCSHPEVVTLGRGTQAGDLWGWKGATYEINRGGRATYHGPSQIVCYPIYNLDRFNKDLHSYLRFLEQVMIDGLSELEISATREDGATGVWVGKKKIASIGIAVKKWVTSHGFAFNFEKDPRAFQGMNPCGFKTEQMTSLQEILEARGEMLSSEELSILKKKMIESFQAKLQ